MNQKFFCLSIVLFFYGAKSFGQTDSSQHVLQTATDTFQYVSKRIMNQRDFKDVLHTVFRPHKMLRSDSTDVKDTRKHFSFVPAIGYTLQTGFAGLLSANLGYFKDAQNNSKLSSINTSFTYSQYNQVIVPLQADIWTRGNRYNFITDIRFISYPSDIYGLGGRTDPNKDVTIDFVGFKIHQTILRALSDNIYIGAGYYFDKFWNIKALDQVTGTVNARIKRELGTQETASGPTVRFLYDTRQNQLNPQQGVYYSICYRANSRALGSDSSSSALQIDARTYFHFPSTSKNIFAFWMLDWVTINGTPPYLLLPSTGWDDSYNTGRGYIQGRFRGRKMLYFESEYRFGITKNGLLGGVAFVNLKNFSSDLSPQYSKLFSGYGIGVRFKLNKYSGANLCIDYGFGQNGSHGFFVNLGEVF
jgi:hypothetical protein